MIEQSLPDCALGLTSDTRSAWRDGGIRGEEERLIRQHTATCPACQERLEGFVTVARALGRQRELEPGDRVWQVVQDRLASHMGGRGSFLRLSARTWQGVAAVASVILIAGLLAFVLSTLRGQRGESGS
jgi:anti-sigma factor RsiW